MKVLLIADVDSPSGYSAHARELLKSLKRIDWITLGIRARKHDRVSVELSEEQREWYRELTMIEWDSPADVVIQFCTPELYLPTPSSYTIGLTQWETTSIPCVDDPAHPKDNWVRQMNNVCQEIWTSSSTAKKAFLETGVKRPVYVFPGPIDTDLYKPGLEELDIEGVNVDQEGKKIPKELRPVTIGLIAQWTRRKNIEEWLLWVMSQFKPDKVVGVLKTYGNYMGDEETHAALKKIKKAREMVVGLRGPPIALITEKFTDEEIARFFSSIDIYCSFSRGEGFGLPLAQAMSSECLVAHTGWSSVTDFLDDTCGYPLNYTMEPVTGMTYNRWYRANMWWASVDILDASVKVTEGVRMMMEGSVEEKDKIDALRTAARRRIIERCSVEATAARIEARLRNIQKRIEVDVGAGR
jgi:glycosyltransferase involved in cell wall biosynthesis